MEWSDILQYALPIGMLIYMMKNGGCCGGHNHSNKGEEKKDTDSNGSKKSCH